MSADSSDSNHSSNCTEEVFKESTWNIIRKIVMLLLSCILLIVSCFFAFFESRRQGDVMNAVEEVLEVVKTLIPN
ncbi:hypothetical protein ENUP19_0332G0022 [Entamoeba nuttalli]|uniref:Uncharacterized protein n=1 Tax=Entamoeba nuttalli TaxID=412467 RepID=A0ABQ0D7Q6_9EUKA